MGWQRRIWLLLAPMIGCYNQNAQLTVEEQWLTEQWPPVNPLSEPNSSTRPGSLRSPPGFGRVLCATPNARGPGGSLVS
jgi:hypothetical protein